MLREGTIRSSRPPEERDRFDFDDDGGLGTLTILRVGQCSDSFGPQRARMASTTPASEEKSKDFGCAASVESYCREGHREDCPR
jgi:hypothetical protein